MGSSTAATKTLIFNQHLLAKIITLIIIGFFLSSKLAICEENTKVFIKVQLSAMPSKLNLDQKQVFFMDQNELSQSTQTLISDTHPPRAFRVNSKIVKRFIPTYRSNRNIYDSQGNLLLAANTDIQENALTSDVVYFSPLGNTQHSYALRRDDFKNFMIATENKSNSQSESPSFFTQTKNLITSLVAKDKSEEKCADADAIQLKTNTKADCQGRIGSCVTYSVNNALEFSQFRFNQHKLGSIQIPNGINIVPPAILTEPVFLLSRRYELSHSHLTWLWRDRFYIEAGNSFLDGSFTGETLYSISQLIKDPQIRKKYFFKQNANQDAQKKVYEIALETQRKIDELIKKTLIEYEFLNEAKYRYTFYDIEVPSLYKIGTKSTLKSDILSIIDNSLEEMLKTPGLDNLSMDPEYAENLQPLTIYSKRQDGLCNSDKLSKTIKRSICSNIPLHIEGLANIYGGKHAVTVVGFKKHGQEIIIQNSNGTALETRSTKDICNGLDQMYALINSKLDVLLPSQDFGEVYPALPLKDLFFLPDLKRQESNKHIVQE